jgi:GNAT superfamily N-acetyltransferase
MRIVQCKNYELIKALDKECFPGDAPVEIEHRVWFVAWDDGVPVAFAGCREYNKEFFLSRAGVIDSHRGQGIQRKLINARNKLAKSLGYKFSSTYTLKDNTISSNNLIKCGYLTIDPEYAYAGDVPIYWIKKL